MSTKAANSIIESSSMSRLIGGLLVSTEDYPEVAEARRASKRARTAISEEAAVLADLEATGHGMVQSDLVASLLASNHRLVNTITTILNDHNDCFDHIEFEVAEVDDYAECVDQRVAEWTLRAERKAFQESKELIDALEARVRVLEERNAPSEGSSMDTQCFVEDAACESPARVTELVGELAL